MESSTECPINLSHGWNKDAPCREKASFFAWIILIVWLKLSQVCASAMYVYHTCFALILKSRIKLINKTSVGNYQALSFDDKKSSWFGNNETAWSQMHICVEINLLLLLDILCCWCIWLWLNLMYILCISKNKTIVSRKPTTDTMHMQCRAYYLCMAVYLLRCVLSFSIECLISPIYDKQLLVFISALSSWEMQYCWQMICTEWWGQNTMCRQH